MASSDAAPSHAGRAVVAAWAAIAAVVLGFAAADAGKLGLYYDEAFMAQQARDFVDPSRPSAHPGSVRSVELLGRPFPTHNAAYLGSLKSQLTIPSFAVFGATPRVLRVTTCAVGLLGLLLAMWFVATLFGPAPAIVMGALAASDPAFFFLSQVEWGPFTTNLLCRAAGACALLRAWRAPGRAGTAWAAAAGAAFGLGIYSRADAAIVLAAAGLALLAFRRDVVATALRDRRAAVAAGGLLLLAASFPMWSNVDALFSTGAAIADRGDLGERIRLAVQTLDGTRFHRLMEVGGVFERAASVRADATPLLGTALGGAALLFALTIRRAAMPDGRRAAALRAWLLATTLAVTVAMIALPGAVRAHHQLNAFPLWHAVIAVAVCDLFAWPWRDPKRAMVARGVVAVAVGFVVAQGLASIARTRALIEETGGRGRWTNAIARLADEVEPGDAGSGPAGEVVSLDWGFHEPLLLLTRTARLEEAIWDVPAALRAGRPWGHRGDAATRYVVHDEAYDLFGLGPRLLALARATDLEVETYEDRAGAPAFYVVRVPRPHVLVFDGRFRVEPR